jgi:phosphate ABC transporter permease subunit PstA
MNRKTKSDAAIGAIKILAFSSVLILAVILGYLLVRGLWKKTYVIDDVLSGESSCPFSVSSPLIDHLSWFVLRDMAKGDITSWKHVSGDIEQVSLEIDDSILDDFARYLCLEESEIERSEGRDEGTIIVSSAKGKRNVVIEDKVLLVHPSVMQREGNSKLSFLDGKIVEELREGRVSSWKDIGGRNLPSVPVSRLSDLESVPGAWMVTDAKDTLDTSALVLSVRHQETGRNLSWKYLSEKPVESGAYGGISTIIVNTLLLVLCTLLVASPLGIATALYLEEYAHKGRVYRLISDGIDILSGIPSIIFGLFGMLVFVQKLHWGFSLASGAVTVSLMVLPTIVRTSVEAVRSIPGGLREASLALGATRMETIFRVVLPSAKKGILTGLVLALGRTLGETAALLFTIGSNTATAKNLLSSCRVLAMHIYLSITEGQSMDKAFASSLVLIVLVLGINITAHLLMGGKGEKK